MKARFISADHLAADTAGFRFELSDSFHFEAGQTCDVTIPSPKYNDEKGPIRTFSVASSPADAPRVLFAARLRGSAFKRTLLEAAPGLEVEVEGPFGSFVLHKSIAKPAVFFAGGIGITPFHSIIKAAIERRLPHRLTLFYSNRTAGSTVFLADLEAWQRANANFRLIATITKPSSGEPWRHHTGLLDAASIKLYLDDSANAIYYLAGPPGFVKGIRAALDVLGTDPDNIRSEEFAGY
jgi:ferredoxin-NADP reductase